MLAAPYISILAVIGIIYGALVAMVQTDVKKLVAYSSVSHLGFVVLGIFAMTQESIQGAVIQMINHGLSTGALFLLVGIIYERTHTREISDYGGIAKLVPDFFLCLNVRLTFICRFAGIKWICRGVFNSTRIIQITYTK